MTAIFKIHANVLEITEEIFRGAWTDIVGVINEWKRNILNEQKNKGHPRNINQKFQKNKYMTNHDRVIFQNCQRCERFIEKKIERVKHKTLENTTNLRSRKTRNKMILRIRGEIGESDTKV